MPRKATEMKPQTKQVLKLKWQPGIRPDLSQKPKMYLELKSWPEIAMELKSH